MPDLDPKIIAGYHAHVYYDAAEKDAAAHLRNAAEARFGDPGGDEVKFGRWHDNPVGPHPTGSYQIAFPAPLFSRIVPWLALNRAGLTVFVHPNTGQDLEDHRDRAIWLGTTRTLDLSIF
jgi:aromatic ring-cleaving dioxygenase